MNTIETPIELIFPYYRNNKNHSPIQVERIARSIKEYGFNQPVVCDKEGVIIVGHARVEAAKKLGLKTVPVLTVDITDQQAKEYRILDNKLSDQAEYNLDFLMSELEELQLEGFDLEGWGLDVKAFDSFEDQDYHSLTKEENLSDDTIELDSVIKIRCLEVEKEEIIEALKDALELFRVEVHK